jgi:hypothetical protein
MAMRCLFLVNPQPLGFIPVAYVLLIGYSLVVQWRRRNRTEIAATVLPFALLSLPFAESGVALPMELPSCAYEVIVCVFLLLAAAKAIVLCYDRYREGAILRERWKRLALAVSAPVAIAVMLFIPYRTSYAYMNELRFLTRSLPREKATILTIWDPTCPGGDYDCCLALPYPTLLGDFPDLKWVVLTQQDADPESIRRLHFDYYYPGTLAAVDIANLNRWFIGRLFPDPERNARQQEPLHKIQSIDDLVRKTWRLQPIRSETVPADTFSFAPFAKDRVTLTIYANVDRAGSQ